MCRGLGAGLLRIQRRLVSSDYVFVERVLEKPRCVRLVAQAAHVRLVVAEDEFGCTTALTPAGWSFIFCRDFVRRPGERAGVREVITHTLEKAPILTEFLMRRDDGTILGQTQAWLLHAVLPRPGVAKPKLRQQVDACCFRAAIVD